MNVRSRLAMLLVLAVVQGACSLGSPASAVPSAPTEAAASLAAYFERIAAPDQSFHVSQTAPIKINGISAGLAQYELDVSGDDFAGEIDVAGQHVELVAVGDSMWVKVDDAWTKAPRDDSLVKEIVDVFRYAGQPSDLVWADSLPDNGRPQHHFRAVRDLPYQTGMMRDQGITGTITEFDLYVTPDGTPLKFTFSSTADMDAKGRTQTVETDSIVSVTRFGEAITITAPPA